MTLLAKKFILTVQSLRGLYSLYACPLVPLNCENSSGPTEFARVVTLSVVQSLLAGLHQTPGRRAQSVGDDTLMLGRVVRVVVGGFPVAGRVARIAATAATTTSFSLTVF